MASNGESNAKDNATENEVEIALAWGLKIAGVGRYLTKKKKKKKKKKLFL